jgi:dipeptidyl aminopeptidase/acylaminoacyl peptidase
MRESWFHGLLLLLLWMPVLLPAQQKRLLTPEDLVDVRDVDDAQISPDGKQVAFVIREPADPKNPAKARSTNVWMVPADGSGPARPFTTSPKNDTEPRWSPDGRSLAILSNREDGPRQIWLMHPEGGDARKLTNSKTGVNAYKWSRDGRTIGFTASDSLTDEEQKKKDQRDDPIQIDSNHKFVRLWVIGVGEASPTLVTREDVDIADFDWSPDNVDLVAAYSTPDRILDGGIGIFRRTDGTLLRD